MSDNTEEYEEEETGDYVTRSELAEAIKEALADLMPFGGGSSEEDEDEGGWVDVDLDDLTGNFSAADVERIAEQKVREAMRALQAKKPAPKKAAAAKKAAPVKLPEPEPTVPNKKSVRGFLWGEK
jgi:hypothetical protein